MSYFFVFGLDMCCMVRTGLSRRCRILLFLVLVTFIVIVAEESESYFGSVRGNHDICNDKDKCEGVITDTEDMKFDRSQVEEIKGTSDDINVIITFTNAANNKQLQEQFELTVSSLLAHSSHPIALHIIGDGASEAIAEQIIEKHRAHHPLKVVHLNVDELVNKLVEIVRFMQDMFSARPGAYYNQALFFLSTAIHRVLPQHMSRVIMLDADLKFLGDIHLLYEEFNNFSDDNILGIAPEMQPVYRHLFWKVRGENKGTRIGEPRSSGGLPGFNSGVLLLDLNRMRKSELYNTYIDRDKVQALADQLHFKGHLGDQDFFTLLGMKHEELFYVLPCGFNRQLCTWWRDHGYKDVFHLYHHCPGTVLIYHGNCKTPIP